MKSKIKIVVLFQLIFIMALGFYIPVKLYIRIKMLQIYIIMEVQNIYYLMEIIGLKFLQTSYMMCILR